MPSVNPAILKWARESSGMSLEDAARVLKIASADTLASLEAGDKAPSRPQLLNMAKAYRRPLLTFYLAAPPERGDRGEDFRNLPADRAARDEALADVLVRDFKARQGLIKATLIDEDEQKPLPFVGSISMAGGVEQATRAIAETLNFDRADFRSAGTVEKAFAYLRERVEAAGVFVLLAGDLGSHHTEIPVEVFRGFVIADEIAPLVVVNDRDAKSAWSFTLLHEVVHLWLGASGISGTRSERAIERFCNDVAGELLLPTGDLDKLISTVPQDPESLINAITPVAQALRVSRAMVAYKLLRVGRLLPGVWRAADDRLRQQWQREREAQRTRPQDKGSGPSYYVVRRHRLGAALLGFARRSLEAGSLSPTRAARVLGVKPRSVYPLLELALAKGAG